MKYFVTSQLSENISETPEGFLICLGVPIARTGEMIYGKGESPIEPGPDGKAVVYREAREVFRPETMASFEGKPFTIKHPEDFVNPKNWSVLAKGTIQNVRRGMGEFADDLLADILITDEHAIKLVKSGVREVSCGYEAEYIQLGVGHGMQTNIIGNHLALVDQGRAGAAYAINDEKGAKMKAIEKIKGIFAKAVDEAAKVTDEAPAAAAATPPAADAAPPWADAMLKKMGDVMTSIASMSKPSVMGDMNEPPPKPAADAPNPGETTKPPSMDERMAKLEDAMAKLSVLSGDAEPDDEPTGDEEEEQEDDDFEETTAAKSGDTAARIEILAPGLKAKGKDAKRAALETACKTADHKVIIETLNNGKPVDFKKASAKTIDHLFIGAAELISLSRTKDFTKWKQVRDGAAPSASTPMTAEKINEMNQKHYANVRSH